MASDFKRKKEPKKFDGCIEVNNQAFIFERKCLRFEWIWELKHKDNDPMSKLVATAEDLKEALARYAQAYNICAAIDSERQRVQQLNNEINQLLSFLKLKLNLLTLLSPYQPQKQNSDQQTQHQPLLYATLDSPLTTTQDNQQSQPDLLNTTFELQPQPLLNTNVQISPIIPSCQNEPESIPFIDDSLTYSQCEDMSKQLKKIIENHSLLTCSENSPTKEASIDVEPQQTPNFDSLGLNSQDYRDIDIGVENYIQDKLSKEKKSISTNDVISQMYNTTRPEGKYEDFALEMDRLVKNNPTKTIHDYDLVMFAILAHAHFYVVVFDFKANSLDILDNSSLGDFDKYSDLLTQLRNHFSRYLRSHNHLKADAILLFNACRLSMLWRTTRNHLDCAIFVMRHLETYKGGRLKNWDAGFKREGVDQNKQLLKLRKRYLFAMLTYQTNKKRERVVYSAATHCNKAKKKQKS